MASERVDSALLLDWYESSMKDIERLSHVVPGYLIFNMEELHDASDQRDNRMPPPMVALVVESKTTFNHETLETQFSITLMEMWGHVVTYTMPQAVAIDFWAIPSLDVYDGKLKSPPVYDQMVDSV